MAAWLFSKLISRLKKKKENLNDFTPTKYLGSCSYSQWKTKDFKNLNADLINIGFFFYFCLVYFIWIWIYVPVNPESLIK